MEGADRITGFYTRKVKFTSETFCEKFQAILESFPRLQDIHPFHKDLLNTLYDADHFRIALGTISTAKRLVETVSRDYVRLLKYAQSLFQCKSLKRAALGRMATICRRLKDPLVYLEQVRQHLGRLPSIDPNTRTLLICGYPNVGKSSFLKSITRADVDVQPYAFTTKSLFVGHFDYKYLRFQAIDTPGILDHPLEEMNTIEMQSITAIAHLRSAILYFMDLSEQCGYSVSAQIALFNSIKPLFANKLVCLVINKTDVTKPEDLDPETQQELQNLVTQNPNTELLQLSCVTQEGVQQVKNTICDRLIAERVNAKLKAGHASQSATADAPTGRLGDLLARIHVARPLPGAVSETSIPEAVLNGTHKKYDSTDPNRRRLERDQEQEEGGAGVYNIDMKKFYDLADDDWNHDKVPEFFKGRNVADFVDPDIETKLAALEEEEERLEAEGYYDESESMDDVDQAEIRMKANLIRDKRKMIMSDARMKKSLKNKAQIPRAKKARTLGQMQNHFNSIGLDASAPVDRARAQIRNAPARSTAGGDDMDVDQTPSQRAKSVSRAPKTNRLTDGITNSMAVTDPVKKEKAERMAKLSQRKMNRMARQGEADRHTTASLPAHLIKGKRGMGSTRSR
jgi:nucleolar GTP-binding protein